MTNTCFFKMSGLSATTNKYVSNFNPITTKQTWIDANRGTNNRSSRQAQKVSEIKHSHGIKQSKS